MDVFTTESLLYVFWYLVSPQALITNALGGILVYSLICQGVWFSVVWRDVILLQLVTLILWIVLPGLYLSYILPVAACLCLYDRLARTEIFEKNDVSFECDEDVFEVLTKGSKLTQVTSYKHSKSGRFRLDADLTVVISDIRAKCKCIKGEPEVIDLGDIAQIHPGFDEDTGWIFRKHTYQEANAFHILLGAEEKVLHFLSKSTDIRDTWVRGLKTLFKKEVERCHSRWLEESFRKADTDNQNCLNFEESLRYLTSVNRPTDRAYAKELFQVFADIVKTKNNKGESALPPEKVRQFCDFASKKPHLQQLFDKLLARNEVVITHKELQKFVTREQKENVDLTDCREWIRRFEPYAPHGNISNHGFTSFLLSEEQSVFNRSHVHVYQDMTQPLSHYFIATSHNTYLMRDQLKGRSSVDMYKKVFKMGCKCVELDCWDGPNNEPIIYHGHTLTSKIQFKDVIVAIRDHAFVKSPYPVVLSIENHCSIEQQKVMARYIIDILGEKLLTEPLSEDERHLPSPDDLKDKILIKAKKLSAGGDVISAEEEDESSGDEYVDEIIDCQTNELDNEKENNPQKTKEDPIINRENSSEKTKSDNISIQENNNENLKNELLNGRESSPEKSTGSVSSFKRKIFRKKGQNSKKKLPKLAKELSDLVVYCQAVHFQGFHHAREQYSHCQMSSFGEKKSMKLVKEEPKEFASHNTQYISRIYPAGSRVDSSNYNPVHPWNVGCQMVALNYQTGGIPMQLNQGRFLDDNGGCGYILKPDFLRTENISWDPRGPFNDNEATVLVIRLIGGSQLPYQKEGAVKSEHNFLVRIRVSGVEADTKQEDTRIVRNNGFNPIWNETFGFKVNVPELALVKFTAKDGDNFLGQYTLPFCSIQEGYRHVKLRSKQSEDLSTGTLYVHMEKKKFNSK